MKDIIFVIDTLRMGGAEKSLVSLLNSLDPDLFNVDLFVFEPGGVLEKELPGWVNVMKVDPVTRGMLLEIRYYLKDILKEGKLGAAAARIWVSIRQKLFKKSWFNWRTLARFIPELPNHYDVAIGYLEGAPDFFVLDKITAEKKIGWIHIDYSGKSLMDEEREYYGRFDEIVTISDICKDAFCNLVPDVKNKISVIENIVNRDDILQKADQDISAEWNMSDNLFHIVTVGRLFYQKGPDLAAEAALILRDHGCRFCWHVYGEGVMKTEIEKFISEHGLEGTFILEGLKTNPYPYMKAADIIVQPSRWEGKSIVLDEAKILGKAIVVTAYQSVGDQITDQKNGIISDVSADAISRGIERVLNDPGLKKHLEQEAGKENNQSERAVMKLYKLLFRSKGMKKT